MLVRSSNVKTFPAPGGAFSFFANQPGSHPNTNSQTWNTIVSNGWDHTSDGVIFSDASAPKSPPNVLRQIYEIHWGTVDATSGTAPDNNYYYPGGSMNTAEIYCGFIWRYSAGWQGHSSSVNKLCFITGGGTQGGPVVEMFGPGPSGPFGIRTAVFEMDVPSEPNFPGGWAESNVGDGTCVPGNWYQTEILYHRSTTVSSEDGTLKIWLAKLTGTGTDSVARLVTNYGGLNTNGSIDGWKINPTWGGTGDDKAQEEYLDVDECRTSWL